MAGFFHWKVMVSGSHFGVTLKWEKSMFTGTGNLYVRVCMYVFMNKSASVESCARICFTHKHKHTHTLRSTEFQCKIPQSHTRTSFTSHSKLLPRLPSSTRNLILTRTMWIRSNCNGIHGFRVKKIVVLFPCVLLTIAGIWLWRSVESSMIMMAYFFENRKREREKSSSWMCVQQIK